MRHSKETIQDLAIFGGEPAFSVPLHVGKPHLVDRDFFLEQVDGILNREYYTNGGPVLTEFENRVSDAIGVKHCIATCNGTKALEIVTRALGLSGEVIVPSFTFIATAHALYWQGIKPVFCDIEADAHQIDVDKIEALITPRTTGILAVHLWGNPCDIDALEQLAHKHKLKLVFDASHSFGATYKGRSIGCFGDAEAVSFHATKMLQAFEGGAILTNDDDLAEKTRLMTNFGFVGYDDVACIGTNGKLSEIHAAMGLTSLRQVESVLHDNKQRYELYRDLFQDIPGIRLLPQADTSNYQYTVIEITHELPNVRDLLCSVLQEDGIFARRYFFPGCHNMAPYDTFPNKPDLPVTDNIASKVLVLPTGPAVSNEDIELVVCLVKFCLGNIRGIVQQLGNDRP